MASLFRHKKSPYWYISWYNPDTKMAGAPISTRTGDKREAMRVLRDFESKQINRKPLLKEKQLTIIAAKEYYLKNKFELSKSSRKTVRLAITHLLNATGDIYIDEFQAKEQLELQLYLSNCNLSVASKNIYLRTLKAFFNFFVETGQVNKCYIKLLKEQRKDVVTIPQDDLDIILGSMKPAQKFLFQFLLHTGLRIGEALALKGSNINMDERYFTYYNFKAKKNAVKGIIEPLYKLLVANGIKEKLFPYDKYYSARIYWRRHLDSLNKDAKYKEQGKIFKYNIHQLRKTCTSYLIYLGLDAFRVKEYIGHSDIKTTLSHYTLADAEKIRIEIDGKIKSSSSDD